MNFLVRKNSLGTKLPDGSGRTVETLFVYHPEVNAICYLMGKLEPFYQLRANDTYICSLTPKAFAQLQQIAPERCKVVDIYKGDAA